MPKTSKLRSAPGVRERINRDGTSSFQIRWQSRDGRPQSATRDTFDEATAYRAEQIRMVRLGGSGDAAAGRIAFTEWFDLHHLPAKERTGRPSTHATRRSYYRNHIATSWAGWRLADITTDDIETWLIEKSTHLQVATVRKIYGIFAQAISRAHKKGRIATNPTSAIDLAELGLAAPGSEVRFMDPVESAQLEDVFDDHWRLTVPFETDSGLRIGELAVVRVNSLNLLRGSVAVTATLTEDEDGRLVEGPPKTVAGKRVVPTLGPDLVDRLADHIRERRLRPGDYLFSGERGGRMDPDNFRSRVFNPAVEAAGLAAPFPTPHSLRHTAVSLWIAGGMCRDVVQVAQLAGHEQLASVYKLYGHLFETSNPEGRERMQAFRVAARLELEGRDDEVIDMDRLRRPGRT